MLRGHETELSSRASTTQGVPSPFAPQASPVSQPKLLPRMHQALRSHHYSRRTEQTYCHWARRFIFFDNVRLPPHMPEPEINVRDGKGARDRITMLPASARNPFQEHLRRVHPMTREKRVLMLIRITLSAIWPNQMLPFDIQRLMTPGGGYPQASYTDRYKERLTLCAYI